MNQNWVKSNLKCKCGSVNLKIQEVWTGHFIEWIQEDGKFDRNDGVLEMGNPSHVIAECGRCKRVWRVRGALQIDDVIPKIENLIKS